MRNWKFHASVIAILILTVVAVFALTGQFKSEPVIFEPQPAYIVDTEAKHRIGIARAHWGTNCLLRMQRDRDRLLERMETASPAQYRELEAQLPSLPEPNNALVPLRKACENEERCEVEPDHEMFGTENYPGCRFQLEVDYRCKALEPVRKAQATAGSQLILDCSHLNE